MRGRKRMGYMEGRSRPEVRHENEADQEKDLSLGLPQQRSSIA